MSSDSVKRLKSWIRAFSTEEGRKPQAVDMPEHIRKNASDLTPSTCHAFVSSKCVSLVNFRCTYLMQCCKTEPWRPAVGRIYTDWQGTLEKVSDGNTKHRLVAAAHLEGKHSSSIFLATGKLYSHSLL